MPKPSKKASEKLAIYLLMCSKCANHWRIYKTPAYHRIVWCPFCRQKTEHA